ncbi:hypothetical protein BY996DRAFT_6505663 [Phakopsora pachyrhizi]|uniref:Uncharacterized protein n=1 Tax=Phakopsora pachyrhizi TaxID=170000 RepID=A0AAV0BM69_PHAPC|nr:hypothetical protein BY996DRAFT_6505663 [Phakopsora pachyrhizi]CAH7688342.1 hypothetical protein PPACK8108_LOCUS23296 [Phakopsora pachyrhizi]
MINQLDITSKGLNLNNNHQKHQIKHQPEQRQDECPIEQSQQSEETLRQSHKTSEHQQEHQKLASTTANPNPRSELEQLQYQLNENQSITTEPTSRTTEDIQAQPKFTSPNPKLPSINERWFIKTILWSPFPLSHPNLDLSQL